MSLKITRIEIKNLGGIEHEELEPLGVNLRVGKNATGKTSFVRALQAAFSGGDNQALIRAGADEGSVVVALSDGHKISRWFRRDVAPITVVMLGGVKQRNPQTIINGLLDSFSIDIRKWLSARDEEKAALILESMPLRMPPEDAERLISMLPVRLRAGMSVPGGMHAITYLAQLRKAVYDQRTTENREAKRITSSIDALRKAIPPEADGEGGWKQKLAEAEKRLAELETTKSDLREDALKAHSEKLSALQEEHRRRMADLETEFARNREMLNIERDKDLNEIDVAFVAEAMNLKTEVERARAGAENEVRAEGLEANIKENLKSLCGVNLVIDSLERALETIDEYKTGLLARAPIAGLAMGEGGLELGGVALGQVNTARLLELSLDIAMLRMGDSAEGLRTVFVDGFECLDEAHRAAFIEAAKSRDIQIFGGMLAECEARVLRE